MTILTSLLITVGAASGATLPEMLDYRQQDTMIVSLESMVRVALENELTLRSGRLDVPIAEAGVLSARARFDPALQMGFDLDRSTLTVAGTNPFEQTTRTRVASSSVNGTLPLSTRYGVTLQSVYVDPTFDQTGAPAGPYDNTLTFSLTQPLLQGFGSASGAAQLGAANRSLDAAEYRLRRLLEQTIAAVEIAYWQLADAEAAEAVAQQSLERAQILLDRNQELRRLDRITEVSLLTSQVGVTSRRSLLFQAQQRRQDAADRLIYQVYGETAGDRLRALDVVVITAGEPVEVPAMPDLDEAMARALIARGDVIAARLTSEVLELNAHVSRNALLPSVNLTGSYTTSINDVNSLAFARQSVGTSSLGWAVGVSAFFPLFNSQSRSGARELGALVEQQALTVATLENFVRTDVRQTVRAIEIGTRVLATADTALQYAQRQYDMEGQRLDLGLSESFRILQFEDQVAQAETTARSARYALAIAITQYRLATGRELLDKYGIPVENP